jgi:DNA primase
MNWNKTIFCIVLISWGFTLWFFYKQSIFHQFQDLYEAASYQEAQVFLQETSWRSSIQLHNLWNTYYRLFEQESENLSLLESAVKSYSWSLQIKDHPDTRYNYEYTKKLLETLQAFLDEQKQEETNNQEETPQDPASSPGSPSSEENGTWASQQTPPGSSGILQNARDEQYKLWEEEKIESLTPEERDFLDASIEALQEEQKYNQSFYGKQSEDISHFQKRFENMMWGSQEKDW